MEEIPSTWFDKTREKEITQEERDKLIHFNTVAYWHCYYDKTTNKLYDQFCGLITTNAKRYLLNIGAIDEDNNVLFHFEEE